MSGVVQFVYIDRPGLYEVPVEEILSLREGDIIIIDWRTVKPEGAMYIFQGLHSYDPSTDTITHIWRKYIEKDYPKLIPKYEIVESAPDYVIVRRYDGQLFKFVDNFVGEIVENIFVNAGKSLWDLIVLESLIEAKENLDEFERKDYRVAFAKKVVMVIGFLVYVCDLVELRF